MKTTKGGKVMNPTDAYRKELRKKELKRVFTSQNYAVFAIFFFQFLDSMLNSKLGCSFLPIFNLFSHFGTPLLLVIALISCLPSFLCQKVQENRKR